MIDAPGIRTQLPERDVTDGVGMDEVFFRDQLPYGQVVHGNHRPPKRWVNIHGLYRIQYMVIVPSTLTLV